MGLTYWLGLAFVALIGLNLGSFVNALEWRLRKHRADRGADSDGDEEAESPVSPARAIGECLIGVAAEVWDWLSSPWRLLHHKPAKRTKRDKYSIATGRSMCPRCEHELAARDLVPVASWLWLRGKCRYCRKPISRQYPLVEALTAVLFTASYLMWPLGLQGYGVVALAIWLLMLTGFVALGLYDSKWHYLPNELLYPLLWLMVGWLALDVAYGNGVARLVQAAVGVAVLWGLFFIIYCIGQATNRALIGYGDVRCSVLLGLLVGGPLPALFVMFLASLLGTLAIIPLAAKGQATRTSQIPYGPFLLVAGAVVFLLGDRLTVSLTTLLLGA